MNKTPPIMSTEPEVQEPEPDDDDFVVVPSENDVQVNPEDVGGIAAIGAIAGLAIAGPIVGLVTGLGLATVAIADKGDVGDSVRKGGRSVSEFNKTHKITEKTATAVAGAVQAARNYDEEHKVVEKTRDAISGSVQSVQDYDKEHKIFEKTKAGTQDAIKATQDFDEKHKVVDKTKKGVKDAINAVQEFDKEHHVLENTMKAGGILVKNINSWVGSLQTKDVGDSNLEGKSNNEGK